MDETQQTTPQETRGSLNPLLIIVILIIVVAVGVMLWLGSNKTANESAQVAPTTTIEQGTEPTTTTSDDQAVMERAISVEGGNFYFKPNEITVKKGEKVTITLTGKGMMHNFVIEEFNVTSDTINSGETTTITFTPDKAGSFEFYCNIGQHRQNGMKGTLIVEE